MDRYKAYGWVVLGQWLVDGFIVDGVLWTLYREYVHENLMDGFFVDGVLWTLYREYVHEYLMDGFIVDGCIVGDVL